MSAWTIGVMGGSGLYDMVLDAHAADAHAADAHAAPQTFKTQWGKPSAPLQRGKLAGVDVVFLPRHGVGHKIPPHKINYRANIAALKQAGVSDIISISACGSLREEMKPGSFVLVDQFIDRTSQTREKTFFDEAAVHVPLADPTSARLRGFLAQALEEAACDYTQGGTYVAMQGPQFSTRAESKLHKAWGADVVGMTNQPEAKLAREAELPYATLALVTDYDSWSAQTLEIEQLLQTMGQTLEKAKVVLQHFIHALPKERTPDPQGIETILDSALITQPEHRGADFAARHSPITDRVLAKRISN